MSPVIAMWLWWLTWAQAPRAQCTRCGGNHPLSRCPLPPAVKEIEQRRFQESGME